MIVTKNLSTKNRREMAKTYFLIVWIWLSSFEAHFKIHLNQINTKVRLRWFALTETTVLFNQTKPFKLTINDFYHIIKIQLKGTRFPYDSQIPNRPVDEESPSCSHHQHVMSQGSCVERMLRGHFQQDPAEIPHVQQRCWKLHLEVCLFVIWHVFGMSTIINNQWL